MFNIILNHFLLFKTHVSNTFASYGISGFEFADNEIVRKSVAIGIIWLFALVNLWSVKGMGKIEDIMVYTKLFILFIKKSSRKPRTLRRG